jgi:hypothetical protein
LLVVRLAVLAVTAMRQGTLDPDEIGRGQIIVDPIVTVPVSAVGYAE